MVERQCIDAWENYPRRWWFLCNAPHEIKRIRFRVEPGERQWWPDRACFAENEV